MIVSQNTFSLIFLVHFCDSHEIRLDIYRSIEECRRISDNNGAFLDKVTAGVRNYFLLPYGDHHRAVIRSRKILLCSRRKKNRRDVPFLMSSPKKKRKKEKITVRSNSFVQAAKEYSE